MRVNRDEFKRICEEEGWEYVGYHTKSRDVTFKSAELVFTCKASHFPPQKLSVRNLKDPIHRRLFVIKQFEAVHGVRYDYGGVDYVSHTTKIKIKCKDHGVFEQVPDSHLAGNGCPECAKLVTGEKLSEKPEGFLLRYDGQYELDMEGYKCLDSKIKARCPEHGWFTKTARKLLLQGCPKCSRQRFTDKFHASGWVYSRSNYTNMTKTSNFYLIRCTDGEETFLKVGMAQNLSGRIKSITRQSGYAVDIVQTFEADSGLVWDLERDIKVGFKDLRHHPAKWFSGHTECFSVNALPHFIKAIKKHLEG